MITSVANRQVRALRRLRTKENRDRLGITIVEGRTAVANVLAAGGVIDRLVVTPRAERSATAVVKQAIQAGAQRVVVDDAVMGHLCSTASPPLLYAVARRPRPEPVTGDRFCWLLVEERDPGALAAILRAAAAFGVGLVACAPGCTDPFSSKAVRASAGAAWLVPIEEDADPSEVAERAHTHGARLMHVSEGASVQGGPLPGKLLVVLGVDADRLGQTMRLEALATQPGLPAPLALPVVLTDWSRGMAL